MCFQEQWNTVASWVSYSLAELLWLGAVREQGQHARSAELDLVTLWVSSNSG